MCSWFLLALLAVAIILAIAIPIIYSLGDTASDSAQSALATQAKVMRIVLTRPHLALILFPLPLLVQ
jgi:uncharacterized protein (UPF0333 family)